MASPSLEATEWTAPLPPNELNHQLDQLEAYLQSTGEANHSFSLDDRTDEILRVAEFFFGSNLLTASLTLIDSAERTFTRMSSPHRSLCLVKGSGEHSYLCFCDTPRLQYCSCRSFLDKVSKSAQTYPDLCKHLLALKLMPHLGVSFPQITTSDEEFARLVLDRTMGHARPTAS